MQNFNPKPLNPKPWTLRNCDKKYYTIHIIQPMGRVNLWEEFEKWERSISIFPWTHQKIRTRRRGIAGIQIFICMYLFSGADSFSKGNCIRLHIWLYMEGNRFLFSSPLDGNVLPGALMVFTIGRRTAASTVLCIFLGSLHRGFRLAYL